MLAGKQFGLEVTNTFKHQCRSVAKISHMIARYRAVLSNRSYQRAKVIGDFIRAADNLIGSLSDFLASRQADPIDSSNSGGSEPQWIGIRRRLLRYLVHSSLQLRRRAATITMLLLLYLPSVTKNSSTAMPLQNAIVFAMWSKLERILTTSAVAVI
jgi:hypothetical protein